MRWGIRKPRESVKTMWDERAVADVNFNSVISPSDRSGLKTEYVDLVDRRLIVPELEQLPAGAKVLDFGCGVGRLAQWPEFDRLRYYGVDRSEKMVQSAREYSARKPNRHFSTYDGSTLPFESGLFDCIVAVWVIQHILEEERLGALVRELDRVLKPGGKIILIEQISDRVLDEALPGGEVYKRHRQASALTSLFGLAASPAWHKKTPGFALHGPFYRSLTLVGYVPLRALRRLVPAFVALDELWYRVTVGTSLARPKWMDEGLMIVKKA
jgi:SAM-dependent methyltransferase